MPLTLTTADVTPKDVRSQKITSFSIDLVRSEIHVAFDELDLNGVIIGEKIITISGPDFATVITNASTIATVDVYVPLKTALYAQIQIQTGKTGTVV